MTPQDHQLIMQLVQALELADKALYKCVGIDVDDQMLEAWSAVDRALHDYRKHLDEEED